MIVIGEVTQRLGRGAVPRRLYPGRGHGVCLCALVAIQAHLLGWPKDTRRSLMFLLRPLRDAAVPLVIRW
jgi:hypothetical protein